jgi:hypothetical protein
LWEAAGAGGIPQDQLAPIVRVRGTQSDEAQPEAAGKVAEAILFQPVKNRPDSECAELRWRKSISAVSKRRA